MSRNVSNIESNEKPEIRPTTDAQRAASRANGAKSQGPVTPEGKARSALNALKHGMYTKQVVMTLEHQPFYDKIRDDYYNFFQPKNRVTAHLIESLTLTHWHINRLRHLDTLFVNIETARPGLTDEFEACSPDVQIAMAFKYVTEHNSVLTVIARKLASHQREFHRMFKQLVSLCGKNPPIVPEQS